MKNKLVNLSLIDRMMLPGILKQQTDYKTLLVNTAIAEKIKVTDEEITEYAIQWSDTGVITMNGAAGGKTFSYTFTDLETLEIFQCLRDMDDGKQLTIHHMNLYKEFML